MKRSPAAGDIHFSEDGLWDVNTQLREPLGEQLRNTASARKGERALADMTRPVGEGLLASTYAEDDKARLSLNLAGLHEEVAEPLWLVECCDVILRLISHMSQDNNTVATEHATDTTPRLKDEEVRVERTTFLSETN